MKFPEESPMEFLNKSMREFQKQSLKKMYKYILGILFGRVFAKILEGFKNPERISEDLRIIFCINIKRNRISEGFPWQIFKEPLEEFPKIFIEKLPIHASFYRNSLRNLFMFKGRYIAIYIYSGRRNKNFPESKKSIFLQYEQTFFFVLKNDRGIFFTILLCDSDFLIPRKVKGCNNWKVFFS